MIVAIALGAASLPIAINLAAKYTFLYPYGTWRRLITSHVIQYLTATSRRDAKRAAAEAQRVREGKNHVLTVYYAPDDAHSHVLLYALCDFVQRYDVELDFRTIEGGTGHSTTSAEQRRWQREDALLLAELYNYPFNSNPGGTLPSEDSVFCVARATLAAKERLLNDAASATAQQAFLKKAIELSSCLFGGEESNMTQSFSCQVSYETATKVLRVNRQSLTKAGHYLSGMIEYAGEFYWGVDRLRHLEERLQELVGAAAGATPQLFNKTYELRFLSGQTMTTAGMPNHPLELFYSPRSPYSQLALHRAIKMAEFYDVQLLIKPVFPMVMRNLPVPRSKQFYIIADMKRESDIWGFPFAQHGFKDPLWEPTFRFMAVWPYAVDQRRTKEFALAFAYGVYCDGLDFGTDVGMKAVVEKAGLDYETCLRLMNEAKSNAVIDSRGSDSRLLIEPANSNVTEMRGAGLWGVPCLRYSKTFVWGADRLWAIEAAILADLGTSFPRDSKL